VGCPWPRSRRQGVAADLGDPDAVVAARARVRSLLSAAPPPSPSLVCPYPLSSLRYVSHPLSSRRSSVMAAVDAGSGVTSINFGGGVGSR
jgi:hypothetical protein